MAAGNSFFALRHGKVRLHAVQLSSSFEPGFVRLERMEALEREYRLTGEERKGYYGPVPAGALPDTAGGPVSPWYLLPHQLRPLTHEQRHRVEATVAETGEGWRIRIRCDEPEGMMAQAAFVFGGEAELTAQGEAIGGEAAPGVWFWREGVVRCEAGGDWMELDGGAHEHRGSVLRNTGYPATCRTLLVNLMTPYDKTFEIRLSPQGP
jgi:hypothetical protein